MQADCMIWDILAVFENGASLPIKMVIFDRTTNLVKRWTYIMIVRYIQFRASCSFPSILEHSISPHTIKLKIISQSASGLSRLMVVDSWEPFPLLMIRARVILISVQDGPFSDTWPPVAASPIASGMTSRKTTASSFTQACKQIMVWTWVLQSNPHLSPLCELTKHTCWKHCFVLNPGNWVITEVF